MNLLKTSPKEIITKSIEMTDALTELTELMKKIQVLSVDMCDNYINKINFKSQRGKLTAEYDFDIIKVMMDVLCNYIDEVSEISKKLPNLSNDIYAYLVDNRLKAAE